MKTAHQYCQEALKDENASRGDDATPQEWGHNPYNLPAKALVPIMYPKETYRKMRILMDEKRPKGMRLRYTPVEKNLWLIESRSFEALRVAKRAMKDW